MCFRPAIFLGAYANSASGFLRSKASKVFEIICLLAIDKGGVTTLRSCIGIPLTPKQGPESPFPGKEGLGAQEPPFPFALTRAGNGSFQHEKKDVLPVFPCRTRGLPFPGRWEMGIWGPPKPSFPGNGDSAPSLGGGIPSHVTLCRCKQHFLKVDLSHRGRPLGHLCVGLHGCIEHLRTGWSISKQRNPSVYEGLLIRPPSPYICVK